MHEPLDIKYSDCVLAHIQNIFLLMLERCADASMST